MFKRHTLAPLATLLVLVMAFLVPAGQASARQGHPQSPTYCCASLSISPSNVVIGQHVYITGSGFYGYETVYIYVNDPTTPIAYTAYTDSYGQFNIYEPIYTTYSGPTGRHALVAIGQYSGESAETFFTIRPKLTLRTTAGPAGTFVQVSGNGFDSYESIQLVWDTPYKIVGYATALKNGTFTGSFTVPRNAPRGTHTVTAIGQTNRLAATAHFTVR